MPIRGEAGMGYILEKGFDLPPLMLHARRDRRPAVLGAQWVTGHADPRWRARDLMAKIAGTPCQSACGRSCSSLGKAAPVPAWYREPDRAST